MPDTNNDPQKKNNGFLGRHRILTFIILPVAAFILILAVLTIILGVSADAFKDPDGKLKGEHFSAIVHIGYYFIEYCITFLIAAIFCIIAIKLHVEPKWPAISCFTMAILGLIMVVTFKADGGPGTRGLSYGAGILGLKYYLVFLISPKGLRLYLPILTFLTYIIFANRAKKAIELE